ncbi:hypothetical protein [Streptomyces atratus]
MNARTDPSLTGRTGVLIGPSGSPDDTLRHYLTPEGLEAVRRWTPKLLD